MHTFFCSSFFLRLQGQPAVCLLLSSYTFYVHLHGKHELFDSDHLLLIRGRRQIQGVVHRYRDTVHGCRDAVHRYRDVSLQLFFTPHFNLLRGLALILRCLLLLTTFSSSSCTFFVLFTLSFSHLIVSLSSVLQSLKLCLL